MSIKGKNIFGIKLEDYSDYKSYKKALNRAKSIAHGKTKKRKLYVNKFNNSEKMKLSKLKYLQSDKGKLTINNYLKSDQFKSVQSKYKKGNGKFVILANTNKRRASRLQRTPAWADLEAIKQFYLNCPEGYHVDHDVPLQGVNVSGLHVLNNLVYLTASDNVKKGNKWPHNYSAQNGSNSNLAIV